MTSSGVADSSEATSALDPQYLRQMSAMLQEVLDEPGRMTIAVTDNEVVFTDADGRAQRFKTNNAKEKHQLNSGTAETKTKWDHGRLVKETSLLGLATVKELYTLDSSGHLEVDVKVERVRVAEPFVFKVVYSEVAGGRRIRDGGHGRVRSKRNKITNGGTKERSTNGGSLLEGRHDAGLRPASMKSQAGTGTSRHRTHRGLFRRPPETSSRAKRDTAGR